MKHLKEMNLSYFGHMRLALGYASELSLAVIILTIHAFVPYWFESTGSAIVTRVYERMKRNGTHSTEI
jgi:hypothetical protein